jgi:hypothetical protein
LFTFTGKACWAANRLGTKKYKKKKVHLFIGRRERYCGIGLP